ncbi:Non-specific serine/threonine protein kinase protein [Dioscorea alata]|uniref:Non-specific serine/threonine protein kinase protein n=1 Tax=Dioscorea alata TaxID=55571 RepID=A0ACB7W791_DIOAL|nr:Non-specific serine/threonine protein kinase protein [Dioscorea alata]
MDFPAPYRRTSALCETSTVSSSETTGSPASSPTPSFSLSGLVRLDLSENNFSGRISPGFNNFTVIRTLLLQNNSFSGEMPEMSFSRLKSFDISYNNLNGSIPRGMSSQPASSFLGMSLCGGPLRSCQNETSPTPSPSPSPSPPPPIASSPSPPTSNRTSGGSSSSSNLSGGAIAGIAVGSAAGVLLLLALLIVFCNRRRRPSSEPPVSVAAATAARPATSAPAVAKNPAPAPAVAGAAAVEKRLVFVGGQEMGFDLEDLLRASAEVLGKGTIGTTYKAVLEKGQVVAVKRLRDVGVDEKEFRESMEAIGELDHENVVKLRAYYYSRDEKLLVYEFMPLGSLSSFLQGNKSSSQAPLNWSERCSIALSAARGIEYIHSKGSKSSHGGIKSSNVLLGRDNEAQLSDNGLAQLITPTENLISGYTAPEVTDTLRITQKSDVYSFGVLLLELISGKAPSQEVHKSKGGAADLPGWVQTVAPENWRSDVFDTELQKYQDVEEEIVQLLQLGVECASQYQHQRPLMSEVVARIEAIHGSKTLMSEQQQEQQQEEDSVDP